FQREAKTWARFKHPYILPFYGFAVLEEIRFFLVSPWANMGNCMKYLEDNPGVSRHKLVMQIAEALDYLHSGQAGMAYVHGDLKGDNVLISDHGNAMLCDFGLTRCAEKIASMTQTPSQIHGFGHVRFSAPEILLTSSRPTTQSDVFAFGCLVIQIFSGRQPYSDLETDIQVIIYVTGKRKPGRPKGQDGVEAQLDDDLWSLLDQCLDHEPASRPTIGEVAKRLKGPSNPPKGEMVTISTLKPMCIANVRRRDRSSLEA
ncbi:hypothetical protein JAAARDRAFT_143258, partial [Jaapia argillacea MUCL 33604]